MVSALDSGASGPGSSPGWDIVLCSWARNFNLTVPLSTQLDKLNAGGQPCDGLASLPGESRNTRSRFLLRKLG